MARNNPYWDERGARLALLLDRRCKLTAEKVGALYDGALEQIRRQIAKLFERYVRGYHVTPEQAMALLTVEQTKEARRELLGLLETCTDAGLRTELRARLDAPAYAYRISRMEALRDQVYFDAKSIGVEEIEYGEARMKDVYEQGYYRTAYDLSQEAGVNIPVPALTESEAEAATAPKTDRQVQTAMEQYYSQEPAELAKSFSARVWNNTEQLAEEVREIVTRGLMTGESYQDMAKELEAAVGDVGEAKRINPDGTARTVLTGSGAKYRAARLIRTEGNYIAGQAKLKAFREAGIDRYLFRALLEVRTCKTCGALDGRDFPVDEAKVGVNMHPIHPHCRCFIAPYHDREWLARYTRSAQTGGKNWGQVPQSMTYQEWYAKYVKGSRTMESAEKAVRNKAADKVQFAQYRAVLGTNAPKSLAEFQQMKYNDPEKWEFVQLDYSRRNELIQHPETALPNAENAIVPEPKFTKYLFGGTHENGLAKGRAFTSRLGYDSQNWQELQAAIADNAGKYPVINKGTDQYGTAYEQKMILYGAKGTPANVIVGWKLKSDGALSMSSTYVKEVK